MALDTSRQQALLMKLGAVARHLWQPKTWLPLAIATSFAFEHWRHPRVGWTAALFWVYAWLLLALLGYLCRDLRTLWQVAGREAPAQESLHGKPEPEDKSTP